MDVKTVTVIGAGTMGAGIAQTAAQAGYKVHMVDSNAEARQRGFNRIVDFWDEGIRRGKTTPDQKQAWLGNLNWCGDLEQTASESDLVIEAVPEDMGIKRATFAALDDLAPEHAVLASNTSSLSVTEIAAATSRPERVLGMHFFNPVPIMKLLEIVHHEGTGADALAVAHDVGAAMGKQTITVRDCPGFASSRLGVVLGNEAMRMVEQRVASVQDIDTAMRLGYGHPMGPLELSDLVGLDVRMMISEYMERAMGDARYAAPSIQQRLVDAGDLGRKTGRGFYDWSSGKALPRDDLPLGDA